METATRRDSLVAILGLMAGDASAQNAASTRNPEAFRQLSQHSDDRAVVMLNLLKFRHGGEELYRRYAANFRKLTADKGVTLLYAGRAEQLLIGDIGAWDLIALVRYPSRKRFLEIVQSAEYQKITADRTNALERAVLYSSSEAAEYTPA
ncbi:MAG: DUF1330 domain-containing protein [Bryobacteraceae bacterium]|nr:DUF1330 domain-containing protein [Bryobacteraceae bacterium]